MEPALSVGEAFFPLDEELGLVSGGLTPRGEQTLVRLASWMPYAPAQEMLEDLVGVRVSKATARRATLATGTAALAVCEAEVERLKQELPQAPDGADKQALSGDGAMVHLVGGEWVEVKTLALGEVTRKKSGEICTQHLSYFSRLSDATRFAEAALIETHRRGLERATDVCAVQDGAEWLQGLVDYHRADAVRILDFAHAAEYVNEIGQAVQAAGGRLPGKWLEGVLHWLKQQGPDQGTRTPGLVSSALSQSHHPRETDLFAEARSAHAVPDLSDSGLADWLRECGKRQQAGRGSTLKRSRHALGAAERQSHAGAAQRRLQSALARDLGGSRCAATHISHESTARSKPTAPGTRLGCCVCLIGGGSQPTAPSSSGHGLFLAQTFPQTSSFLFYGSRRSECKKMKRTRCSV